MSIAEADITDLINGRMTIETLFDLLADPPSCGGLGGEAPETVTEGRPG